MPAPRLFNDVEMLLKLMEHENPAKVPVRFNKVAEVVHGFGDDSGGGLVSMTQSHRSNDLNIRIGVWSSTEGNKPSSNWKEFGNVVGAIENEGEKAG